MTKHLNIPPHWQPAFTTWLNTHISSGTRKVYLSGWRNFLSYIQKDIGDITRQDVNRYRQYLKETAISKQTGKSLSGATINLYLAALSSFYTFALEHDWVLANPVDGVTRMPISPYEKARWLQGDDDLHLLNEINHNTPKGKRDYAIILLFLTAALRLNEVVQLTVGSLKSVGTRTLLSYRKKGGADAQKVLAPITAQAIQTYLATRDNRSPQAPLFVAGSKGIQSARNLAQHTNIDIPDDVFDQASPLSGRAIEKMLATLARRAFGDNHGITVHSLRHTAAMKALEGGHTITEISDLLKHKNTRVTAIYLHRLEGAGDNVSAHLATRYNTDE